MSAWNFKSQFAAKLIVGTKLTTIRAFRKLSNDPKVGDIVTCYQGMRTKSCVKLITVRIIERANFDCVPASQHNLTTTRAFKLDGLLMSYFDIHLLAQNDGFDSLQDFFAFFPVGFHGYHYTFELVQ